MKESNENKLALVPKDLETFREKVSFSEDMLVGAAGRFARMYSEYLETPVSFLFFNYLTCLGTVVSYKVALESEIDAQPRLYTINLGESSITRKSTSIKVTIDFFEETFQTKYEWVCHGVGSAEGLAEVLSLSPVTLLCVDELKTLMQKMTMGNSVLLPCLNSLFESNHFHSATRSNPICLNSIYLSLLGACTTDTFKDSIGPKVMDIGFANRLFLVLGESKKKFAIPRLVPQKVKEELQAELVGIFEFAWKLGGQGVYLMPIQAKALKEFEEWYFTLEASIFTLRLDTYALRLMPLLALNDNKSVIDEEVVKNTIKLLDYEKSVRQYAAPIEAVTSAARLEEKIKRSLKKEGSLSKRELERQCHKHRYGTALWLNLIQCLKQNKVIFEKDKVFYINSE